LNHSAADANKYNYNRGNEQAISKKNNLAPNFTSKPLQFIYLKFSTDIYKTKHNYTAACKDNMTGKDRMAPVEHSQLT